MTSIPFANLEALAVHLRQKDLTDKKYVLVYAYNGTGKTRLSMAFKDMGKRGGGRDTLYFNAFTEDLFTWDNDLDGDSERILRLNSASAFFSGLEQLEMENRIRPFLQRYADFDFSIDYSNWTVSFSRELSKDLPANSDAQPGELTDTEEIKNKTVDNIKISRGEENIFIWCFFLAVVQLALDGADAYSWVKFIYVDDPISSLDEHNAIAVANNLAQLLKKSGANVKMVVSSHHTLFFNVLCNELKNANRYFLSKNKTAETYKLRNTGDTPFFHHVATLAELYEARMNGRLYTYHFNMLRAILEKTASFHGYKDFSACIKQEADDPEGILHTRIVNILNHGNYSLYEPQDMMEENKDYFKKILDDFLVRYPFNPELFPEASEETETP